MHRYPSRVSPSADAASVRKFSLIRRFAKNLRELAAWGRLRNRKSNRAASPVWTALDPLWLPYDGTVDELVTSVQRGPGPTRRPGEDPFRRSGNSPNLR